MAVWAMKYVLTIAIGVVLSGCAPLLGEPEVPKFCYRRPSKERRCFRTEQALSADVYKEEIALLRAAEERAKQRALAVVAERDASEAAERARRAVDHADRVQDGVFDILVELHELAQERAAAANQPAAPSPGPQTPPAP
jgi:hypothetical protein